MRHNPDARTIKVDKVQLIAKIRENKEKHKKEYVEAVEAFKMAAARRLKELSKNLAKGDFSKIRLQMTEPENREAEYDKLITQFEWEIDSQVELSQGEFNEYIHDETSFAKAAKFSNMTYLNER